MTNILVCAVSGQRQARLRRAEMGRRQQLGQDEARSDWQPEVPPRRQTETGPYGGKGNKRLASRFYQFKTGHCLTGQYLSWTTRRPDATRWWCPDPGASIQELPPMEEPAKNLWATVLKETRKLPGPTRARDEPAPRNCSPTSGAARRCSSFSRQRTSVGRQAHRWPRTRRTRPVRPRSGKRGTRRSEPGRGGRRRRGWAESGEAEGDLFPFFFLSFTFFNFLVFPLCFISLSQHWCERG